MGPAFYRGGLAEQNMCVFPMEILCGTFGTGTTFDTVISVSHGRPAGIMIQAAASAWLEMKPGTEIFGGIDCISPLKTDVFGSEEDCIVAYFYKA